MALFYGLLFLLLSQESESFVLDFSNINSLSSILSRFYETANANRVAVCGVGDCEGTLWSPEWVFTTIECTRTHPIIVFRMFDGIINCSQLSALKSNATMQRSVVQEVYRHPLYEAGNMFNIAMLHLTDPLPLNYLNNNNHSSKFVQFKFWIDFTKTNKNIYPATVARSIEYTKPVNFNLNKNIEKKSCKFASPKLRAMLCFVTLAMLPIVLGFLAYNLIQYLVKKHEAKVRLQQFLHSDTENKFTDNV